MKPCEAARKVLEAASPGKGGAPGFRASHVFNALRILKSEPGIGRPRLQSLLGLGEAATRTLIHRLVGSGLAAKPQRGLMPTDLGLEVLSSLSSSIHEEETPEAVVDEWGSTVIILLNIKPPMSLTEVYSLRDYIVEEGCRKVIIGGLRGGSLALPGVPEYVKERIEQVLPPQPPREATLIVVPGECRANALSAAIRVLAEQCSR